MKATKIPRRLLISAVLFSLPVVIVSWWVLATEGSDAPAVRENLPNEPILRKSAHGSGSQPADSASSRDASSEVQEFQDYAAELRTKGLPENTVRELVASRITAAYQTRRAALRSKNPHGDGAALQYEINRLNSEQGALIARLVGSEEKQDGPAPLQGSVNGTPEDAGGKAPIMPAVMASTPPATLRDETHLAEWEKLRNDFVQAIGGPNQDPSNPDYRQRWIEAQSQADQRFRFLYGDYAYVALQLQAQREAQAQQQAQPQR